MLLRCFHSWILRRLLLNAFLPGLLQTCCSTKVARDSRRHTKGRQLIPPPQDCPENAPGPGKTQALQIKVQHYGAKCQRCHQHPAPATPHHRPPKKVLRCRALYTIFVGLQNRVLRVPRLAAIPHRPILPRILQTNNSCRKQQPVSTTCRLQGTHAPVGRVISAIRHPLIMTPLLCPSRGLIPCATRGISPRIPSSIRIVSPNLNFQQAKSSKNN